MNSSEEFRSNRLFHGICLAVLFVVASAASFSSFYQKWHFREAGSRGFSPVATFDQMVEGTAWRPYIYRQLLPDAANWITSALPIDSLSRHISERAKQKISAAFNLSSKKYPVQYLIVYNATYLSALLATFALYLVCTAAALSAPIPTLFLIWFVWRAWRLLPRWLKRHAQIAAVINFPLYILLCQPGEYRDLSLLYIAFLLIIALSLQQWMRQTSRTDSQSANAKASAAR